MPLWGNYDNAANSDIGALMQVNHSAANTTGRDLLFNNVTANTVVKSAKGAGNVVVGQFFANTAEMRAGQASPGGSHPQHAGWVLRHEGRGLKAGRVWYETLVAMGSSKSDASDDTYFPDFAITVTTQPTSNNFASAKDLTFTVAASSTPSGATLAYQWQKFVSGNSAWVNIPDTVGYYSGNGSTTLTANNLTANGNVFRAVVSTTGANSVTSGSATITLIP
jgi:hypothetical protein